LAAAFGRRGRTNRNKTIKGKEWNREACASKERRTKADARSRLFPARSNPWGEFGIGRWPWGRANGQLGMEIQNTTRPHDWSCILMKGDRQGPRKVVRRTHTHTHTEAEGGETKWVEHTWKMEGSMEGGSIHRGKRGTSGCGPPPFWQREPVKPAGCGGDCCNDGKGAISGAAWAGRSLAHQASPGLLAVFSKNRRTRYCRPKPSNRPCPPRRNAGLSARHTVPDAPQFQ
jgi:hypothetical protein